MKEYEVKLTKQAETQIHEIAWYITVVLKNPDAAENLMDEIDAAMEKLKKHPAAISLTDEEPWRSTGIRSMGVKNFLIYFWINENNLKVQVTGVVYAARDQRKFLAKMQTDEDFI